MCEKSSLLIQLPCLLGFVTHDSGPVRVEGEARDVEEGKGRESGEEDKGGREK